MIKKLLFILLVSVFMEINVFAQQLNSFNSGIFKSVDKEKEKNHEPHITDFRYQNSFSLNNSIFEVPRTNPGVAFLASAIVPGAGQAANGKWVRAGIYFTVEVVGLIYHLDRNALARRQEEAYEQYTHESWSVVAYAQWLVQYSDANTLSQENLNALRNMVFSNGRPIAPSWGNTPNDWAIVDISVLHDVENQTPFIFEDRYGSIFSHELPAYGSQQYYELISKYYQFQAGWQDFHNTVINENSNTYDPNHSFLYGWDGQDLPNTMFYRGRDLAEEFNDNYRTAGNILKLLLVNHVVSAFDALFTVQLKNSRIETNTNLMKMEQFSLTWHF